MYQHFFASLDQGATLVAANRRLSRTLRHSYARAQIAAGRTAWHSPDIVSWQNWLRRLWDESRLRGGQAVDLRLISETEAAVLWEQAVADDQPLEAARSELARHASEAWQLACDWDAVAAPEWTTTGLSPDQQLFLRWSGRFRDTCSELGIIDQPRLAGALTVDFSAGIFDAQKPVLFAGFDTWTGSQRQLRETMAARGIDHEIAEHPSIAGRCQRLQCETSGAELEQAARWARLELETDPELQIGIVVPDLAKRTAEVRRIFMEVLCPQWRHSAAVAMKSPVNISYGEALANKPRVAAALSLLQLVTGIQDYKVFSLVLRTPFVAGGRGEAGGRAQLDLRLRDKLGAAFYASEVFPIAQERAPEFATVLELLAGAAADLSERSLATWADWVTALLRSIGWPGDDMLDSVAYQELEAWNKLLADFAASSGVRGPVSWPAARRLLTQLAWERLYQPQGDPDAVQIMGTLEAAGHAFDRLWVTGMAAEDWPAARHPHPLLPFSLQRRCGIPGSSPAGELEYARQVTTRLATSATQVVISWPLLRDGQKLHASELIQQFPEVDRDGNPEDNTVAQWTEPLWAKQMLGEAATEILREDHPVVLPQGSQVRGGARLFNLQVSCPLRAFLELRLGATEIDQPIAGIGFLERGSLAHDVLEDFYTKFADSAALAKLELAELDNELQALLSRRISRLPGMQRPLIRTVAQLETQRLLALMKEFLKLETARDAFHVVETEQLREVAVGPVKVRIKLDRLDRLSNGALLVIDYKTGRIARSKWNPDKPADMQLPLYATFSEADIDGVAFAQISVHGVKLEGLSNDSIDVAGIEPPDKLSRKFTARDGDRILEWESLKDAWRDCLLDLAEDFARGDCSINPKYAGPAEGQFAVLTRVYELPGFAGAEQDD